MGNIGPVKWFDEKYSNGNKPTLEDRTVICKTIEIPLTDRAKRKLEEQLKECLFILNQPEGYSPSVHVLAYNLLFCIAPIAEIDVQKQREYVVLYQKAMEKHKEKIRLDSNFKHEE